MAFRAVVTCFPVYDSYFIKDKNAFGRDLIIFKSPQIRNKLPQSLN